MQSKKLISITFSSLRNKKHLVQSTNGKCRGAKRQKVALKRCGALGNKQLTEWVDFHEGGLVRLPPPKVVTTFSQKVDAKSESFFEFGAMATMTGKRPYQEDGSSWFQYKGDTYLGLFDGHGGDQIMQLCRNDFGKGLMVLLKQVSKYKALRSWFSRVDENSKSEEIGFKKIGRAGATCMVAVVSDKTITVANAGDCRAVVYRLDGKELTVQPLSNDHNCASKSEVERVEKQAGKVMNSRVLLGDRPFLGVTRAIRNDKIPGITCVPEIMTYYRTPQDQVLIMACDGLWDVMSNEDAFEIVSLTFQTHRHEARSVRIKLACEALRNDAFLRGSQDNITVLIWELRS